MCRDISWLLLLETLELIEQLLDIGDVYLALIDGVYEIILLNMEPCFLNDSQSIYALNLVNEFLLQDLANADSYLQYVQFSKVENLIPKVSSYLDFERRREERKHPFK